MRSKANTWTPKQYRIALGEIAERTASLRKLLMLAATQDDDWERSVCVDAAEGLAALIGAMADGAVGGQRVGDVECWFYGPSFEATRDAAP